MSSLVPSTSKDRPESLSDSKYSFDARKHYGPVHAKPQHFRLSLRSMPNMLVGYALLFTALDDPDP
jgi:hypothetical protein